MEVSEQLTGFEPEDLMSRTVSNLQRPFREDFSLQKSGILADFGGTVLAGNPSKYSVQFVTWDWNYDRTEHRRLP